MTLVAEQRKRRGGQSLQTLDRQITIYLSTVVDHIPSIYILTCRSQVLRRKCLVQTQPKKHAVDHADYTDPTPQPAPQIKQIRNLFLPKDLDHAGGNHLSGRSVKPPPARQKAPTRPGLIIARPRCVNLDPPTVTLKPFPVKITDRNKTLRCAGRGLMWLGIFCSPRFLTEALSGQ